MAAPHVAGLASLIFSQNSGVTNSQVRSIIEDNIDDLGTPGWDEYFGTGRINIYKALQSSDTTPPAIPTGLNAVSGTVGDTCVELTWDANTEPDIAGYNLYRSENDVNYSKMNTATITGTSYSDTNVVAGTQYYYKLTALDIGNNESDT